MPHCEAEATLPAGVPYSYALTHKIGLALLWVFYRACVSPFNFAASPLIFADDSNRGWSGNDDRLQGGEGVVVGVRVVGERGGAGVQVYYDERSRV